MAFTADTRNHFLREARKEYARRFGAFASNVKIPRWGKLTEQQREEWAQYMHDEWLKRPNPPGLRKPDLFSNLLYPVPNMRCSYVEVETEQKPVDLGDMVVTRWVSLEAHTDLEKRVTALEKDSRILGEELVYRFDVIGRRLGAIANRLIVLEQNNELPQSKAVEAVPTIEESMNALLDELKMTKESNEELRRSNEKLRNEIEKLDKANRFHIEELTKAQKECDARKQDEVKLRQSIELLAQELAAERTMPVPYTITVEDFETVKRNFKGNWFMRARWFNTYNIVWMTKEQHELVKRFGHFTEL